MDAFAAEFQKAAIEFDQNKLVQLMKQPDPYESCRNILENTHNLVVIHCVGELLSNAVIREWNSDLRPDTFVCQTEEQLSQTKPYSLAEYLVNWTFTRDFELSVGCQLNILKSVVIVGKLLALDEISKENANVQNHQNYLCPLLKFLIATISTCFNSVSSNASYNEERKNILNGLAVFSALITEFTVSEMKYDCLDLPMECFHRMQDRFENFEWVHLFQLLISLIDALLSKSDWLPLLNEDDTLIFRLVNALELVTSFDLQNRKGKLKWQDLDTCTTIDNRWEPALGIDVITDRLSVLLKFYAFLRDKESCNQQIFASIATIVSMTFKDKTDSYNVEHAAICMSIIARSLIPLNINPFAEISATLINDQKSGCYQPLQLMLDQPPAPHSRLARIETEFHPMGNALLPAELPLLSLICGNFFKKVQNLLYLVVGYFHQADNMGSEEIHVEFSATVFYLKAAYEFLTFAKNILYACLIVEAGILPAGLSEDQLQDAVSSAHEASERLLGQIRVSYCSEDFKCETSLPIPLTTGKMAERDYLAYQLKQAYIQTRDYFEFHLRGILRVCIASRITAPEGFRNDVILSRISSDPFMSDMKYFEDSLFEIGRLANSFQCEFANGVFEDLYLILSNRLTQWTRLGCSTPKTLLNDIHQVLLFLGHILVTGSSEFGTIRGGSYSWEELFSETCAFSDEERASRGDDQFNDVYSYLIQSISGIKCERTERIPAFICIFQILFQLFDNIIKSETSTPQLVEDTLLIFTRLVLTFFSFRKILNFGYEEEKTSPSHFWFRMLKIFEYSAQEFGHLKRLLVTVAVTLTRSIRQVLERWFIERRVVERVEMLLFAIARHILPFLGKACPAIDQYLLQLVELWRELCSAMISTVKRSDVSSDVLTDFINACVQGAWYLREAAEAKENLFSRVLGAIHAELEPLKSEAILENNPDQFRTLFISGLTIVRGLSRALCGIMRDTEDAHLRNSRCEISIDGAKNVPEFMWQASFANILSICVGPLSRDICSAPDVFPLVLSTFDEVAEGALVYLLNVPVDMDPTKLSVVLQVIGVRDITLPVPHTAATEFLLLSMLLCHQYKMAHFDPVTESLVPVKEKREEDLLYIFSMLNSILHLSMEMLMRECEFEKNDPTLTEGICFVCIRMILPLMTEEHLKVPEILSAYFTLISNIIYDSTESICKLIEPNDLYALDKFSAFLQFGLVQDVAEIGKLRSLDVLELIVKFCTELGANDPLKTTLIEHLNLSEKTVEQLFDLVIMNYPPSLELQERISRCIFKLTRLNSSFFEKAAVAFVERCGPNMQCRMKLQKNFDDLHRTASESNAKQNSRRSESEFEVHFREFLETIRLQIRCV